MPPTTSRRMSNTAFIPVLPVAVALSMLGGCAAPSEAPETEAKPAVALPATQRIDPTGRWCSKNRRGRELTDAIEHVPGGIIISPVRRKGRQVFYAEDGLNLYRLGSDAAYRFLGNGQATWERKDERRALRRCG